MLIHFTKTQNLYENQGNNSPDAMQKRYGSWQNNKLRAVALALFVILLGSSTQAFSQAQNLSAMFPFNGNATDQTGNFTTTPNNLANVPDRFGNADHAVEFDGTNTYIDAGTTFNPASIFSISLWIKRSRSGVQETIIAKYSDTGCSQDNRQFRWQFNDNGTLGFVQYGTLTGGNYRWIEGNTVINDNEWHHVALSYSYSADPLVMVKMWVDGNLQTNSLKGQTGGHAEMKSGTARLGIGAVLNSAGGVCNTGILFQGAMDDLVFYSRTFTSEDIEYFSAEKELKLLSLDKYKLILNRNFTTQTVQAEALPSGTYTYGIHPASVPFANISMDANTGLLTIESVADQEGFQSFDFFAVTGTDTVRTKFTLDINSIISRVTFDEGTISGTPQPAVFTNTGTTAANDRFGRANHARMFNNTRLYSTMSSPALTNEFSASVWIYPTTTLNANTSVNQFFLYMTTVMDLGYQSGNLKLRLYDGSGNIMNYSMPITMAGFKWHHIIVISEPGQNVKFIVNGQETQLTASPATLYQHSSPQFSIGDFTGGNNPFYGVIDEVNLYNRVFTQKEMSDFSAKPIANVNISDNLLLDLTLDGTLEDLSGNTNHFSVVNGTEIYSEGRFGTPDSSFVFGSSKYLSLGGTEAADLQIPANYTLNMWVKTATTTDQYLYSKGGTSDNVALTTRINANGSVSVANKYAIYANETCPCYTSTITSSHTGLNDGQWHMLTFARTGSATRIFVDGQFSVETSDQYAQYSQTNNWGILIGRNRSASGTEFSGELDNVRFYNRMLTPEDIDALYQVTPSHANTAPALTGTFPEMNVNEDSEEFVVARLDTMVTDADNQPISFSVNSSDENLFTVRIETGHIYLQPAANAYGTGYLQIVAYDQTDSATFDALVTINELNDIPSFNYSKYKVVLSPQSPDQLLTISMNQPSNEANQALTYSISPDPANQQTFSITLNETTGELTVGPGSVPQADTLSFTITVNDGEALNNTYEREVEFIMLSDEFNGLIAHYDFNGNANNVNPLTIGQFDGTVTSSVLANDRLNNPNSAYYFEGTGDYITIANAPEFNFDTDKDYSISLWMRTPYGTTNRMMVDKGNNPRYYVGMGTDGKLIGSIEYGGSNGVHIYSPNRMDDNSWHHIALTVDRDSVMALYVDGEMVASDTLTISGTISTTYGMRFGALSDIANQWNYNGYLDDIRIFNRVISPNEVSVFSDENRPTFLEPVNSAFKQNSIISATDTFRVSFNQDLNPASVANIQVFGSHTGKISGTASANGNTIEFVPSNSYQVGERITFHLPKSVVAASGDTLKRDYWSVNHVKAQNRAHENPMEFYEAGIIDDVVSTFNYAVPSDIDGDGDADVVGVSGGEGKLSLYVNNGSGTFTATELTPPAGSIQYVNVADLTNDGLSDILLIVNFTAYWLKNNGSLNFDAPVSLGTLSTLYNGLQYSILAADIDGDGDQDVIPYSLSSQQGWFYIINNTNAGASFGTPYLYASTNGMGLTVGDLNGDGKAEIVSITQTSIVSYTMSNAASTNIQSTTLYGFPNNYGNFPQGYGFGGDIADMDGDGDNDLIVGSWGTTGANSKVFMLRNNNGFISNSPENIIDFGVNTNTQVNAVKAADVDSDGDLDIVGYGTYSKLYWIENFGNNLYSPSKPISAALTPQSYRHEFPGFADFNNDNYLDVLASGANSFRWFTSSDNLSNTGYTPANYAANVSSESNIELHFDLELNPATAINANFYVHGSFTGKISGSLALTNGNKTLVFNPDTNFTQGEVIEWALSSQLTSVNAKNAKSMSGQFTVTYTKGDNNFYEVYRYDRYNNQEWNEVAAGDFDNDNKIDFDGFAYMTYPTAIYFETFKNTGNGAFSATTDNDGTYAALSNTKYKLFDFNNDGRIDRFYNWRNYARISGMSSNANGSFGAGVDLVSLSYTNDFSFGDVDNDGDADAVLATDYGIERHLNNGNATFTKTTDVLVNQIIVNIQLADMNADGKSDIVYWDGNNNFKFYFNDNGSFTRVASITNNTYSNVKDWAFSDFNADGYTDFVVTRSTNQGVSLFKNNGDGTFTVEDLHAGVTNANKVKVIDLNTDGKPDVLANISGNALVFYANEGNSFAPADTLMNTSSLYDFELADTDNDGDMDIIAGLNHAYAVYSNGLPPNNAPTVVNTVANLSMVEDAADTLWVADVATLFTDADADALTYNVSSDTSAVAASLVQGANGMELHVSLMANYFGTANIEIEAKDWQDSVSTSFVVDVAAVNDSPEFQLSMSSLTVDEDFSHTVIDIYSAHPENESDQTVVYTITNNVTFANVTLSGNEIHMTMVRLLTLCTALILPLP